MQKRMQGKPTNIIINSLEDLSQCKMLLREELDNSEDNFAEIWHNVFHQPENSESSPTKRIMATITSASALIDGALLGWKLYRRLGGTFRLFKKKKK